jgi:hypothetical protein
MRRFLPCGVVGWKPAKPVCFLLHEGQPRHQGPEYLHLLLGFSLDLDLGLALTFPDVCELLTISADLLDDADFQLRGCASLEHKFQRGDRAPWLNGELLQAFDDGVSA